MASTSAAASHKPPGAASDPLRPGSPELPKSATSSKFAPSVASTLAGPHGSTKKVITVPPWARHEQPVPDEEFYLSPTSAQSNGQRIHSMSSHERMPSIASFTSSGAAPEQPLSGNWWTFVVPSRRAQAADDAESTTTAPAPRKRIAKPRPQVKQKNRSSWIFSYALGSANSKGKEKTPSNSSPTDDEAGNADQDITSSSDDDEDRASDEEAAGSNSVDDEEAQRAEARDKFDGAGPSTPLRRFQRKRLPRRVSSNLLRLDLPLPPAPFTKAQTETPGWDSPWNPRKYLNEPEQAHARDGRNGPSMEAEPRTSLAAYPSRTSTGSQTLKKKKGWKRRRRKFRRWILHNLYVPLLFRIVNLAFTSASLGTAVKTRATERQYGVLGILGSSATVTIIFAPITLVHVLIAIYLEYFGRPVGLWKTSAKLGHTLLEVVLICAWSAALALCFNDYFTTALKCGPESADRWWSTLPSQPNPMADLMREGYAGEELCEEQLALICLAFVTLSSYCVNLVISLYRIIEKVKSYSNRARMPVAWH